MNAFQYIVLAMLALLGVATLRSGWRGLIRKRIAVFWLLVWGGGATALLYPRATVVVARALGIGRGTDLLLYFSVIAMLAGFFYTYGRFRRMDRQMTQLVRALAIEGARRPGQPPERSAGD